MPGCECFVALLPTNIEFFSMLLPNGRLVKNAGRTVNTSKFSSHSVFLNSKCGDIYECMHRLKKHDLPLMVSVVS